MRLLLKANKRLNTAYVLKETFGQLWDYQTEGWARRFFENWCDSLKWQRLRPYEICRDDHGSLGRHRRALQTREQGSPWFCRRSKRQNPV